MTTGLKWPEALPIVLYSIRSSPNRTTGLSPHEVLMGRPMSTGVSLPLTPHKATLLWTEEYLIDYVKALVNVTRAFHTQVRGRLPEPSEGKTHPFVPGDFVLIKSLAKKCLSPRWKGELRTAVKVQGKAEWIHASRCQKVPELDNGPEEGNRHQLGTSVVPQEDGPAPSTSGQ